MFYLDNMILWYEILVLYALISMLRSKQVATERA